jgi:pyruvate/2-oxoglutarate dehydrogenase complex dihydrolipoamide acyltransferase (E2) component
VKVSSMLRLSLTSRVLGTTVGRLTMSPSMATLMTSPSTATMVLAPTWGVPTHPGDTLGTVEELLVPVGARVLEGETMAVVETDKVAAEVKAPHDGVVSAVLVALGDEVKEKQAVYELVGNGAEGPDDGGAGRMWAAELHEKQLAEKREAERHWQTWQRRWRRQQRERMEEQRKRWDAWHSQRQRFGTPWWQREREARWERQRWRAQGEQRTNSRRGPLTSAPLGRAHTVSRLADGPVKQALMASDHYTALGLPRSCTSSDVKAAFRRLAHQLHPDTFLQHASRPRAPSSGTEQLATEPEMAAAAHEAFVRVQGAFHTLSNARTRRDYDRELRW